MKFSNILKQLEKVQEVEIEHGQYHYHVRHSEEVVYISSILQMKCKLMSYMKNQSQSSQRYS